MHFIRSFFAFYSFLFAFYSFLFCILLVPFCILFVPFLHFIRSFFAFYSFLFKKRSFVHFTNSPFLSSIVCFVFWTTPFFMKNFFRFLKCCSIKKTCFSATCKAELRFWRQNGGKKKYYKQGWRQPFYSFLATCNDTNLKS